MSWATVNAAGTVCGLYNRESTAKLNAGDLDVVAAPAKVTGHPQGWTFNRATGRWRTAAAPAKAAPADARTARKLAYGRELDGDLVDEAVVEALRVLITPQVRAAAPEGAFAKFDAVTALIDTIKAAHPKT